jgi:hypothetical protein
MAEKRGLIDIAGPPEQQNAAVKSRDSETIVRNFSLMILARIA